MTSIADLQVKLPQCWSLQSSSRWKANNPALGQCGVTALVAHDLLGGDILKTLLKSADGDMWHFYNLIDGKRHDFTASQFEAPITYQDVPSNREEAFGDTNDAQYEHLRKAVASAM